MPDKFYEYTDKALKYLRRFFIREFNKTEMQIRMDDMNVIQKTIGLYDRLYDESIKVLMIQKTIGLYDRLYDESIKVFMRIARNKYKECGGTDTVEIAWLMGLLEDANPVTGYIFVNDKDRKRAYFAESVLSGDEIGKAVEKALRYWYQSVKQYADIVTYEASIQAYTDTKTEFVKYRTADDEHVCGVCVPRNGKIYPLKYAPKLPAHYNCRCYYVRA